MKVSREQARKTRAHVVEVASTQFRQHGFDGIGIADLMKAAGLTHGGFYGQFKSKVDLAAEASRQALALNAATWRETINRTREKALKALTGMYLSRPNLIFRAKGCTFASLCAEQATSSPPLVCGSVSRCFCQSLIFSRRTSFP